MLSLHLGTAVKLAWKAPGLMPCFVGSRQVTDPRLLQQAHQKSGPFPPLALPSLGSTTTLSDPHLCRRLSASLRPLPSPMMGLPRLPVSPFQRAVPTTPADQGGCACRLLPRLRGLPRYSGGSASATSLSRPAQASLTLRPAGLLNRPRRPSSRGFDLTSYPTKPLVSYQINRQLSGWILPPLVIRAVGAHRIRWARFRCKVQFSAAFRAVVTIHGARRRESFPDPWRARSDQYRLRPCVVVEFLADKRHIVTPILAAKHGAI